MVRRYEFKQKTPNTFWEISRAGETVTTTSGELGSEGASASTGHADEAAAVEHIEAQVAGKVEEGYRFAEGEALVGLADESATIGEYAQSFCSRSILPYDEGTGMTQASAGAAYRVASAEDEGYLEWAEQYNALAYDDHASALEALVVGTWGVDEITDSLSAKLMFDTFLAQKGRLPRLRAVFLGDVHRNEAAMSEIEMCDFAPMFKAFPQLEHVRINGRGDFGVLRAPILRSLVLQSGLSRGNAQQLAQAELPELEHLELWLGDPERGGDVQVEDLAPILSGELFPMLRYLGLRNSAIADQVASAVATAPIVERLKTLDLSGGALTDEGGEALAASPAIAKLQRLDLHHNFMSAALCEKLAALGIEQLDTAEGPGGSPAVTVGE